MSPEQSPPHFDRGGCVPSHRPMDRARQRRRSISATPGTHGTSGVAVFPAARLFVCSLRKRGINLRVHTLPLEVLVRPVLERVVLCAACFVGDLRFWCFDHLWHGGVEAAEYLFFHAFVLTSATMSAHRASSLSSDAKHFKTLCFTRDRLISIYDGLQRSVARNPTEETVSLAKSLDSLLTCPVCRVYAPKLNGEFRLVACGCSVCKGDCFSRMAANSTCPRCDKSIY